MKKQILIGSILLLFIGAIFTSCKPTNNELIIGKWSVAQAIATNPADSTTMDVTENYINNTYEFKYAGGLSYTYFNIEENQVDTVKGDWFIQDEELMLTVLDTTHHIQINSLAIDKMEWSFEGINRWLPDVHHKPIVMTLNKSKEE